VATPRTKFSNEIPTEVNVNYDFFVAKEGESQKLLFSESHKMYCYSIMDLCDLFSEMKLIASWDISNGTPSNLNSYGNTIILQKPST
jgi:hypothetical protein